MTRKNLEEYLEWLITPQDDKEQKLFKDENLVDDYINIYNRILNMTDDELMDEIDKQILYTGQSLNRKELLK